jgi:hypothetical protein
MTKYMMVSDRYGDPVVVNSPEEFRRDMHLCGFDPPELSYNSDDECYYIRGTDHMVLEKIDDTETD